MTPVSAGLSPRQFVNRAIIPHWYLWDKKTGLVVTLLQPTLPPLKRWALFWTCKLSYSCFIPPQIISFSLKNWAISGLASTSVSIAKGHPLSEQSRFQFRKEAWPISLCLLVMVSLSYILSRPCQVHNCRLTTRTIFCPLASLALCLSSDPATSGKSWSTKSLNPYLLFDMSSFATSRKNLVTSEAEATKLCN